MRLGERNSYEKDLVLQTSLTYNLKLKTYNS